MKRSSRKSPKAREGAQKPEDIKRPLGQRVRALRERAGFSQRDLAQASGISFVFLGTVERGEKAATVETIEKLARGLGVPPHELFLFEPARDEAPGAEKLARKLVGLARNASDGKLHQFERIARVFFEPEDSPRRDRRTTASRVERSR